MPVMRNGNIFINLIISCTTITKCIERKVLISKKTLDFLPKCGYYSSCIFIMHNLSCVIIISTISLAPIDKDVYVCFATKLGEDNGKQVEKTAIEDLNDLVDGYTYCFQRSMKTVLSLLPAEEAADRAFIFARIDELLTSNTEAFQDSLSGLPPN